MLFSKKAPRETSVLDVTHGPMLKKMFLFAIPVILSGILQQTFNTADHVVVGRYASAEALGGVSATASLINLIICLFVGLSVGAAVAISQSIGARDEESAGEYTHSAIAIAILGGIIVGIIGFVFCKPILELMGTPRENIKYSIKYMRIYFCGAPFVLLYNYGSAILRTLGDTRRPLIFLIFGGIVNVILNLFFVIGLNMDADGVAIATVASNIISSSLVLYTLTNSDNCCRIYWKKVRISPKRAKKIMLLGIPAGIQSAMFSLSNVIMQSSINFFGSEAVAGNGASVSVETYAGFTAEGFAQAALTFSGQNTGAKEYKRLKTVFLQTNIAGVLLVGILSAIVIPIREFLIGIFIPESPVALSIGCDRLLWVFGFHFLATAMTVSSSCLRGMGKSLNSMIVSVFGVCVLRVIWIYTVFKAFPYLKTVYIIYPISWAVTLTILCIIFAVVYKKAVSGRSELKI